MEKVSVVIPCFNGGEHLDAAVTSALAQTYPDLEVIIVDDGSTDPHTLRILDQSLWSRTRIFHQLKAGPAAARNRAIHESDGQYILPLDADDTIEPSYVEKAVEVLRARPTVGCVYCKAMKFGAECGVWDLPPYCLDELVIDNIIFVTALFRKKDWAAIGGFDEGLQHGVEDYGFWVKLVAAGKEVVQLDEYLFNYRVQDKSRTTRFQDDIDNKVSTYAQIFRRNRDFYATHAETVFKHRFGLYAQIRELRDKLDEANSMHRSDIVRWQEKYARLRDEYSRSTAYWRDRYGSLDSFFQRHQKVRKLAARLKSLL